MLQTRKGINFRVSLARSSYLYDDPRNKEASFVALKPGFLGHGWSMVLIPARERLRQEAGWGYIIDASESYIWL